MLTRILCYANKLIDLKGLLHAVTESPPVHDNRRYGTGLIAGCLMTMALCRMGSFHHLEENKNCRIWRRLMGHRAKICGADTLGRRCAQINVASVRSMLVQANRRMRRAKSFQPLAHNGFRAVVLDGHEVGCSYLRDFGSGPCLERQIETKQGMRTQYYQRLVAAVLVCDGRTQLLDIEMQQAGEDEVTVALRLLDRIEEHYGHLFDLVMADGLYPQAHFFKRVRALNKHIIAVLKNERRDLTKNVRQFIPLENSIQFRRGKNKAIRVEAWDMQDLSSWPQAGHGVRVVRTVEKSTVQRQAVVKKNSAHGFLRRKAWSGCGLQP